MQPARSHIALTFAAALAVSGCTGGAGLIISNIPGDGPDEFSVLPGRPLEQPASYGDLPEPTPGGTDLAGLTPRADAVAAMGGNPAVLRRSGIPAADSALLGHVSRYGVSAGIREELARADEARRRGGIGRWMAGLFGGNPYFALYRGQWLDKSAELERLRAAGVVTPSAPPR